MKPGTLAILFLVTASVIASCNDGYSDEPPKPFMGINHELVKELPSVDGAPAANGGIGVTIVQKDTPAFRAGLIEGDIIIGVDGFPFDVPHDKIGDKFSELLYRHLPGDSMWVTILRMEIASELIVNGIAVEAGPYIKSPAQFVDELPETAHLTMTTHKEWLAKELVILLGVRNETRLPPLPELETTDLGLIVTKNVSDFWRKSVDEVVKRYQIEEDYSDLRDRLRAIENGDDGTRLQAVAAIHRDPFILEPYGRRLTDRLMRDKTRLMKSLFCDPDLAVFITSQSSDFEVLKFQDLPVNADVEEFAKWFNYNLTMLITLIDSVFTHFSSEDREFLMEHRFELSDAFAEQIYIHTDEDSDRFERNKRTIELGSKIDLEMLFRAGFNVGIFLESTEDQVFAWMSSHPDVRSIDTPVGKVGFGTETHDRWDTPDFKFIYDPDGGDFYANGTGVAGSFDRPLSWIIDRGGDDAYQSTVEGAQGSGLPGVGVLIDRSGDDTYIGSRWSQGTGFMGVGVLIDEKGDDIYRGTELVQGAGLFGMGVVADVTGDDTYTGTIHAQGVGFTHGLGLLLDYAGNDYGYCGGKHPTNYGDPGIFDAWSQGCGMGFRSVSSGGIGVVVDAGGTDKWEAGNFSQGGGYYYGLGIFRGGGKSNDTYIGSRYGQGFCAHQAAGLFIEDGGDDFYTTRQSVVSGLAWDQCVTVFVDEAGNDRYNGGTGFSLGASAHNSICLFIDKAGSDEYIYKSGPGRAGDNKYHGGISLSLFIDAGKEKDFYNCDKVRNNVELAWPEFGIFRDGKGRLKSPQKRPE